MTGTPGGAPGFLRENREKRRESRVYRSSLLTVIFSLPKINLIPTELHL
jgi:hypothetical protein